MATKYDDSSWHSGGDYPPDLPAENASTHAGMFLAWAIERGLAAVRFEATPETADLASRKLMPGEFFRAACDGKLTNDDFNDEGNRFAADYYATDKYFDDYGELAGDNTPTLYHLPDTWTTFNALTPTLDARLKQWRAGGEFA